MLYAWLFTATVNVRGELGLLEKEKIKPWSKSESWQYNVRIIRIEQECWF